MLRLALLAFALSLCGAPPAWSQTKSRVWDVPLGTPASALPRDFMLPACGTNGGPPSARLERFDQFARCPIERGTGLREIWFSYDDEAEYIQRAYRAAPQALGRYLANQLFAHPVLFSILVDDAGTLRGWRVLSDPREDPSTRVDADVVATSFRGAVFGPGDWTCTNLPVREGEQPMGGPGGRFVKESCTKVANGRHVTIETHAYLKPGQAVGYGPDRTVGPNEFDVRVRIEVLDAALVR